MMILRAVQTVQIPREHETKAGPVPLVGNPLTVTRGWFQCQDCHVVGAFDSLASPMAPPPCPLGCDGDQAEGSEQ